MANTHSSWYITLQQNYRQLCTAYNSVQPVDLLTSPNKNTTQNTVLLFSLRRYTAIEINNHHQKNVPKLPKFELGEWRRWI